MNKKLLTPLKISSIRADELSEKKSPGNNSQRIKRENLKQYLSSNDIKLSHHSNKKPFELTESHLFLPTSPRVLQKLATSTDNKQCTKEKCIDKMIALKLANKNVLKVFSMNRLSREEILKEKLFITIPDELKKLDQGGVSERTEASKLLEWFEVMEKTQLERCLNREKLNKLDFEQQKQELDVAESILSLGLVKLIDQVQTHCNEQAIAIRKIFAFYKKFWKIVLRTKLNSSEQHGIVLCSQMDNLKSEQIALVKLHKAETQKLKSENDKLILQNKIQELEIERLNRNVKGLKNERADKLKKELETYEKMIRKIKRKVSILSNFKSSAPKIASFKKVILAEFHEITKYKEDLIEKTEEEEVCESESLNESLMENKSIFTQTEITVKDQETYIGFVYFNEETQTDLVQIHNTTEKVLKICEENIDEELMRLKELGFIPEDADIESWGAGYYTGIERGQTLGNNEEIGIEENMENNDIDSDESIENELKTPGIIEIAKNTPESETIFISKDSGFEKKTDDRKKKPYSTKIMEFNFKKREKIVHQKALKSKRIRDIIMKKSSENIKKRARMSKKMMLKTINTIYNNLLSKYKQDDFTDDFLSLIYQDFETKYFMKKIVDRKMIEFLCNLLSYCEILKVQTFLKFLDFSDKINQKSLINKKESLQIYLAGLESITKSKLGIMSSFDDTSEFHLIPTVRAIEFIKDRLNEIFPISRIAKCIEFVNRISTHDKKRLNKSGVIELEIFLSFIISQFEEHISRVQYTGGYIIKAVTFENDLEFISKHEITYLSELLGTKKHWKEPDPSQEFIRVEDLFASNIREIFPENFLDELESYNFQDEYDKTQKSLENFEIPEKHRFVEAFQKNGMKLDVEVFQYARKILEMQAEVFSS